MSALFSFLGGFCCCVRFYRLCCCCECLNTCVVVFDVWIDCNKRCHIHANRACYNTHTNCWRIQPLSHTRKISELISCACGSVVIFSNKNTAILNIQLCIICCNIYTNTASLSIHLYIIYWNIHTNTSSVNIHIHNIHTNTASLNIHLNRTCCNIHTNTASLYWSNICIRVVCCDKFLCVSSV